MSKLPPVKNTITIKVNGEPRSLLSTSTVLDLLTELELNPRFLAVERNKELVPRTIHQECLLEDQDEIEIVTLVGGG